MFGKFLKKKKNQTSRRFQKDDHVEIISSSISKKYQGSIGYCGYVDVMGDPYVKQDEDDCLVVTDPYNPLWEAKCAPQDLRLLGTWGNPFSEVEQEEKEGKEQESFCEVGRDTEKETVTEKVNLFLSMIDYYWRCDNYKPDLKSLVLGATREHGEFRKCLNFSGGSCENCQNFKGPKNTVPLGQPDVRLVYCATPSRLSGKIKEIMEFVSQCHEEELIKPRRYAPFHPLHALPFEFFEGGGVGRERTIEICLQTINSCNEFWIFGISEGTLSELEHVLWWNKRYPYKEKLIRDFWQDWDPDWKEYLEKLRTKYPQAAHFIDNRLETREWNEKQTKKIEEKYGIKL